MWVEFVSRLLRSAYIKTNLWTELTKNNQDMDLALTTSFYILHFFDLDPFVKRALHVSLDTKERIPK